MSQLSIETADCWRFTGELTFATVSGLLTEFLQQPKATLPQTIDLSGITHTDSAGLALLIELLRVSANRLEFRHVPAQVLNLASVSGVDSLLLPRTVPDSSVNNNLT